MTDLPPPCDGCRNGEVFQHPISMAFQPIISVSNRRVYAYEALVRGADGSGADSVFERVDDVTRYAFDQKCRTTAIDLAARLDLAREDALLSINFLPNAVYDPRACIRLTLKAAEMAGFPLDRIMFEFTESERINPAHLLGILQHYRALGFVTAIDDFGAGYAGMALLVDFVPDVVKLDMHLIRDSDRCDRRRVVLRHMVAMLQDMGTTVVGEGIQTQGEYDVLADLGVDLMQGYLFAAPVFEALADPVWPEARPPRGVWASPDATATSGARSERSAAS
ncbi:EAL domain-containing protein [Citreimonas salinaria]|uniref:EAL domain, c-di-GMP-specific phosphodiesterase class I (Or its enzymatically inactive variant) n=1 Tax=Citreimonas salinaria TaxID=321339 RepID=A0A1H3NMS2_9RHOB|nr:EAL domain-containing protein [Citreimonas salinaria]SDY90206.1 EAL domain, c-di-GMP-specific phosphodiesterase class I (or its enzymatically inactive variant) [Citreimonas salinaria]